MRIKRTVKSNFLAGLVLVTPLVVTLVVLRVLAGWLNSLLEPLVVGTRLATFTANNTLLARAAAIAVIVVALTLLGSLAQRSAGRRLFGRTGRLVNFLPVFRTIYGSIRQMTTSVVSRSSDYEAVVYVEHPQTGNYQLGLKTGDSPDDLAETAGEPAHNVYVPGSPNPTQGSLLLVPESRTHESDLSVRAAVRLLMTTGTTTTGGVIELDPDEVPDATRERENAAD